MIKTYFKNYIKDESGTNLVEFAYILPIFLLMLVGLIDVATMLVAQNALEAGAREASRTGSIGITTVAVDRDDFLRQQIRIAVEKYSGGIIKGSEVVILVRAYDEIENLNSPEPFDDDNMNGEYDVGEFYDDLNANGQWDEDVGAVGSFGASGEAVQYIVSTNWPTMLSRFGFTDQITLQGSSVVKNEEF